MNSIDRFWTLVFNILCGMLGFMVSSYLARYGFNAQMFFAGGLLAICWLAFLFFWVVVGRKPRK